MSVTPEHVALFGIVMALVLGPLVSVALVATIRNWVGCAMSCALLVVWAPVAVCAPTVISQLM